MSVRLAWHYTVPHHGQEIRACGHIKPATLFVPAGEKPVVWFSLRQFWEPTANKAIMRDGTRVPLSMQETWEAAGGACRFGVPAVELLPYRRLKFAANISADWAKGLERAAREAGSDVGMFLGSLESVSLDRCVAEMLDVQAKEWRPWD